MHPVADPSRLRDVECGDVDLERFRQRAQCFEPGVDPLATLKLRETARVDPRLPSDLSPRSGAPKIHQTFRQSVFHVPIVPKRAGPGKHQMGPIGPDRSATVQLMTDRKGIPPIGRHLRRLRRERGFSQEELARRAGVDRGAIAKIETGQRTSPSIGTLMPLASALGVSLEELTSEGPKEHPALRAFLLSPWAQGLASEGRPVQPEEERQLHRIIVATWVEGSPTPQTLYRILQALRDDRGASEG